MPGKWASRFLKAWSHCTGRCKEETIRKKILPFVEKRYASVVYSLSTYFIRSTHQTHVHCDFIRVKSFRLHKTFKLMNIPLFTSVCNIYEQQTEHVRYHPLTVCSILSASSSHPLNSHPLPIKTERRRKDKFHGTSKHRL